MSYATSDAVHPPPQQSSSFDVDRSQKFLKTSTVGVIGCPFSGGQAKAGVDTGPHHLIDFGLLEQIKQLGYDVSFGGHQQFAQVMTTSKDNDPDIGKLKRPRYVGSVTRAVKEVVEERCRKGELVLTLGGDHSLAVGTVSGVFSAYPDACLLWIDAVHLSFVRVDSSMRISTLQKQRHQEIFMECQYRFCWVLRVNFQILSPGLLLCQFDLIVDS
jgi:arginase family enzyme